MTPQEQAQLSAAAELYYLDVINIISTGVGIGMFGIGFCVALWYLSNSRWGHAKIILLSCCLVIVLCSCWSLAYFGSYTLSSIRLVFVDQSIEIDLKTSIILDYINSWLPSIALVTGDFIVTWRAWVLLENNYYLQLILAVLGVANLGTNIASCIEDSIRVKSKLIGTISVLDWLSNACSIALNLCATSLIAWKAWTHNHTVKGSLHQKKTYVQKVLLLLIESGAWFCSIQLTVLAFTLVSIYVSNAGSLGFQEAFAVISAASTLAPAWYPVAVIILIQSNNSPVVETLHNTHSGRHLSDVDGNVEEASSNVEQGGRLRF
ncbi:hypothetical protein DFJ43DRAFT_1045723 [Lentinula guzmanii]|uniref:Uncharacterized protein n=1 Tax=Lentinula guzmanii TaxID=2804957 RepID=A0AA38JUG0_9AGAR|nr:hypothetical protein DFJ43DRAFT_1045723 [Lentinula guzmanii]